MAKDTKNSSASTQKTAQDVKLLKQKWAENPDFDLVNEPGFEQFADELKTFADEKQREWNLQNQKFEFENIQEEINLLKSSITDLDPAKRIEVLNKVIESLNEHAIDLPEFEEFKNSLIIWIKETSENAQKEILKEKGTGHKTYCEIIRANAISKGVIDNPQLRSELLEKITCMISLIENDYFDEELNKYFAEFLTWAESLNAQIAAREHLTKLHQGINNLKIVDFIAVQAMQSLLTTNPKFPSNQLAKTAYDYAFAMMAEKVSREV